MESQYCFTFQENYLNIYIQRYVLFKYIYYESIYIQTCL